MWKRGARLACPVFSPSRCLRLPQQPPGQPVLHPQFVHRPVDALPPSAKMASADDVTKRIEYNAFLDKQVQELFARKQLSEAAVHALCDKVRNHLRRVVNSWVLYRLCARLDASFPCPGWCWRCCVRGQCVYPWGSFGCTQLWLRLKYAHGVAPCFPDPWSVLLCTMFVRCVVAGQGSAVSRKQCPGGALPCHNLR